MRCFTKFQFVFVRGKATWPDKVADYGNMSGKSVAWPDKKHKTVSEIGISFGKYLNLHGWHGCCARVLAFSVTRAEIFRKIFKEHED